MSKKKITAIVISILFIISGIIPLTIGIIKEKNNQIEKLPVLDQFVFLRRMSEKNSGGR